MQRLRANPDSRVRPSELVLPTETPFAMRPQTPRRSILLPIFVIVFGLTLVAIMVSLFREDGKGSWYSWLLQANKELVSSISVEYGLVVQELAITGNRVVAPHLLVEALGIGIGSPMILVDLQDSLKGVRRIGWVESAQVIRHWPNKIFIKIVEKTPVAIWKTSDGPLFIDDKGDAFGALYIGQFSDLPVLRGAGADQSFPELARVLEKAPFISEKFVGATLVGKRRWDIEMEKGLIVRLPEEGMEMAWISFSDHLKRNYLALEGLVVADYTLRDRLVLQFEEVVVKDKGDNLVGLKFSDWGLKNSYVREIDNSGSLGPV